MSETSAHTRVAVIACDVLKDEVLHFSRGMSHITGIEFVPQGLHNEPVRLQRELQHAVTVIEERGEADVIALVYGLCSRGVEELRLSRCRMVIARAHDCVTLFLGDKEKYAGYVKEHPGTYWYSPGWIRTNAPPGPDRTQKLRREFTEKFGEDDAEYLLEMEQQWISHYSRAAYVSLGVGDTEAQKAYTRRCADCLGWKYDEVRGDPSLLVDLLRGNWDEKRFLVLEPGHSIRLTADERIIKSVPGDMTAP